MNENRLKKEKKMKMKKGHEPKKKMKGKKGVKLQIMTQRTLENMMLSEKKPDIEYHMVHDSISMKSPEQANP